MYLDPRDNLARSRYDEETQEVCRIAAQYQRQVPGMTRGEAIRLAEKHVANFKHDSQKETR